MFSPKIIENLENYQFCYNHNKPIKSGYVEPHYPSNRRFYGEEYFKAITIEVHPLSQKDYLLQEINRIINITSGWIQKIEVLIKNEFNYSSIDAVEKLSQKTQINIETQQLINQIKAFNNTQMNKLDEKIIKFLQFEQSKTTVEIFQHINQLQQQQSTPDSQYNSLQNIQQNQKIDQNLCSIQHPYSYAVALHKEKDIIVTSSNQHLRIFQLNQEKIKLVQVNGGNDFKYITTLNFFKQQPITNNFISGSENSHIVMWFKNRTSQSQYFWGPQQIIKGHSSCINCLIIDSFDSLFISGSNDKTIKFWYPYQSNQWILQQNICEHSKSVFSLSIKSNGDQLIPCCKDFLILVMQNLNKQNWQVNYIIKTENYGYRLCFINDNIFTFQPHSTNKNEIQFFYNNGHYRGMPGLQIQGGKKDCYYYFSQVYIPQKQVLNVKSGQYVNFVKFSLTSQNKFYDCKLETVIDYSVGLVFTIIIIIAIPKQQQYYGRGQGKKSKFTSAVVVGDGVVVVVGEQTGDVMQFQTLKKNAKIRKLTNFNHGTIYLSIDFIYKKQHQQKNRKKKKEKSEIHYSLKQQYRQNIQIMSYLDKIIKIIKNCKIFIKIHEIINLKKK